MLQFGTTLLYQFLQYSLISSYYTNKNGSYSLVSTTLRLMRLTSRRITCLHVSLCSPMVVCSVIFLMIFSSIFLIASLVKRILPLSVLKSLAVISFLLSSVKIILSPITGLKISAISKCKLKDL